MVYRALCAGLCARLAAAFEGGLCVRRHVAPAERDDASGRNQLVGLFAGILTLLAALVATHTDAQTPPVIPDGFVAARHADWYECVSGADQSGPHTFCGRGPTPENALQAMIAKFNAYWGPGNTKQLGACNNMELPRFRGRFSAWVTSGYPQAAREALDTQSSALACG